MVVVMMTVAVFVVVPAGVVVALLDVGAAAATVLEKETLPVALSLRRAVAPDAFRLADEVVDVVLVSGQLLGPRHTRGWERA